MSYSIDFVYQGLRVEAVIGDCRPADYDNPAEGGECESYTREVEDLEEVLNELEIESPVIERVYFDKRRQLPKYLVDRINKEWDLEEAATEYFWNDIGGPSGL